MQNLTVPSTKQRKPIMTTAILYNKTPTYFGNPLSDEPLLSFPLYTLLFKCLFLLLIRTHRWVFPSTYVGRKTLFLKPFILNKTNTMHFPETKFGELSMAPIFSHVSMSLGILNMLRSMIWRGGNFYTY